MKALLATAIAAILSLFGIHPAPAHTARTPQSAQVASAVSAVEDWSHQAHDGLGAATRSIASETATTTIIKQPARLHDVSRSGGYITQPVIEGTVQSAPFDTGRVLGTSTDDTAAKLADLQNQINALSNLPRSVFVPTFSGPAASTPVSFATFAQAQKIDKLEGTDITNPTITGGTITAASIVGSITNAISSALATIDDLTSNTITATNASFTSATTTNLAASNASVTSIVAGGATTTNLATSNLRIDSLDCSSYGNGGKLTTDASGNVSCAADQGGAGSTVAGSDAQVQFNSSGGFAAAASFTFASSTGKLAVPYASTTAFTAIGTGYFGSASTTNLTVSGLPATLLSTDITGAAQSTTVAAPLSFSGSILSISQASSTANGYLSSTDWAAFSQKFATTSSDYWIAQYGKGFFFSTTSADYHLSQSQGAAFSTTSAAYFLSQNQGTAFSTTSANTWDAAQFRWATTSTAYWDSTQFRWATTSSNYWLTQNQGAAFSTTSANAFIAATTTSALAEGANKYYTDQRADARINATSSIGTLTSAPNLGTLATTLSGFLKATAGALSTAAVNLTSDVTGILPAGKGGTGWANIAASAIPYGNGSSALATTTAGTAGYVLAYLNGVPTWTATTTFSGALALSAGNVTCNTANGSTFGCLTAADWTTFNNKVSSSRSISAGTGLSGGGDLSADRTLSLNLGNANTWTALQQFGNASTTLFSAYGSAYFGATATSSFDTAGNLTLAGRIYSIRTINDSCNGGLGVSCYWNKFLAIGDAGNATYNGVSTNVLFDYQFNPTGTSSGGGAVTSFTRLRFMGDTPVTNPLQDFAASKSAMYVQSGNNGTLTQTTEAYSAGATSIAVGDVTHILAGDGVVIRLTKNSTGAEVFKSFGVSSVTPGTAPAGTITLSGAGIPSGYSVANGATVDAGRGSFFATGEANYCGGGFFGDSYDAPGLNSCIGSEINVGIAPGSSAMRKIALRLADEGNSNPDSVAATEVNAGLEITSQNGGMGFADGIIFTNYSGSQGVQSTGSLLSVDPTAYNPMTFANAFDLRNATFSGNVIEFGGFSAPYYWDGSGNLAVAALTAQGKVGIGTTTPLTKLTVYDSAAASANGQDILKLESTYTSATVGSGGRIVFAQNGSVSGIETADIRGYTFGSAATGLSFGTGYNNVQSRMVINNTGNVGIGTTTPYSRLTVWGTGTGSTTAFAVVNNASTTAFAVYDNGNATYAGSIFQSSDQRLKTDIQSLDASSSLSAIEQLDPVSYARLDQPSQGQQLGFIAQQLQRAFPQLVATTTPTALTPDGTLTVNYPGLIAPMVKAIQALASQLSELANKVAGFAEQFTTKQLTFARADGDELHVNKLCVGSVCVTEAQFMQVFGARAASQTAAVNSAPSQEAASSTPPVITVAGKNPAHINVGDAYSDLGARITGPTEADTNLGLRYFVDGALVPFVSLDTSTSTTYVIEYVAENAAGTSTSTRTVIVQAHEEMTFAQPTPPPSEATSSAATSSPATTTPQ